MEDRREKWRRVPGSVALACPECNGLITPCIICAHPIPFCGHSIWEDCGHCGVINPMQKLERHFLGLSPPSALTPSMVRRVMVAHVGRHQYTRAVQSRYRQLQMAQEGTRSPDQEKEESVQCMWDGTHTVSKSMANTTLCDLPFVEYDGILPNYDESDELNKSEARDTCEPLPKRMRITSENKGLFCLNVEGRNSLSLGSCMEMPKQFAEVSESRCRAIFSSNNADISQNPYKQEYGIEEQMKEKDPGRKSDEIKSASEPRGCARCGSSTSQISKDFLTAEGRFTHTETQLLALHSAESLSSDLHSSISMYPICGSMHISASKVAGAKACVNQCNNFCGAPQQFSRFSIHILRLAHSVLASYWEMWLAKSKVNMKQKTIEEVLSCAEQFLQKRAAIFHVQGLLQKALAARAQSTRDSLALFEHQVYISVGSLLRNVFIERVQERFSTYKKSIEPFTELLEQISMILKFCFSQLRTLFKDPSVLCSLQLSSASKFDASSGETETVAEALRAAVPLWLVLYHDVAHVTVLGQAQSAANDCQV